MYHKEKSRADAADKRAEATHAERKRLTEELQHIQLEQKHLQVQLEVLKHDKRRQMVGFCAELAKWQV